MLASFCFDYLRHIFRCLPLALAVNFSSAANVASEIQLIALTPTDVKTFLAGWGAVCTARLWSASGDLVGVVRDRNSLLIRFSGEVMGVVLEHPRYSSKIASYSLAGQSDFPIGPDLEGQLEITASPRLISKGEVRSFSSVLSLHVIGSSKSIVLNLRLDDECGSKSRLVYGPRILEKLNRLMGR